MKITMMAGLAKQIAKISAMSVKAKVITAAAVVVVGAAAGGTTYAVVQHNRAAGAAANAEKYKIQIVDGKKSVVDDKGKATELLVDEKGNIVDDAGNIVVAAENVKQTAVNKKPAKKDDSDKKKPADNKDSKDDAKPDESEAVTPDSGTQGSEAAPAPEVPAHDDDDWEEPDDNPTANRLPDLPAPEPEPEPEPDAPVTIIKDVSPITGWTTYESSVEMWSVFDCRTTEEQAAHPIALQLLGDNGRGGVHCEFVSMSGELVTYDITEAGAFVELFDDGSHRYNPPGGLISDSHSG